MHAFGKPAARSRLRLARRGLSLVMAVLLIGMPAAVAQEQPPGEPPPRPPGERRDRRPPRPPHEGRPGDHGPPGFPLGLPLPPSPEDEGPLRPGEADELVEFARRSLPDLYPLLKRMRDRNPAEFEQRLAERAPRLRFLRRIFGQNPRLGDLIVDHSRSLREIGRARQALPRFPRQSPQHREAVAFLRERVAVSLRIEAQVFEELGDMLAANRPAEIDRWVERMLAPDFDALAQPPAMRELIAQVHAADDETRPVLEAELRGQVERRIDDRIEGLRTRAARLREAGPEEVDRRLRRILDAPGPPDRPGPP
jgi:hypothetical protein